MAKQAPFVYVLLIPVTSWWASTTTTTAVRVYNNSIHVTLSTEHFTCSIFGTTTTTTAAATIAAFVVVVVVLINSSLQCSPWSQDRLQ